MKKFLSKLINPKKKIAGLDIGNSSIKFMEIEGDTLENAKVICYAVEPIPKNYISSEGKIENLQAIADIIRTCWKKSGSTTKNVAIALPSSGIIKKKVNFPIMDSEEDLKFQVQSEISSSFPGVTLDEVALDYYHLEQENDNLEEQDLLIVAAKKEKIEERIALVEMAGLIPIIVDIEQYALQNLVRMIQGEDFNKKTTLLLDCSSQLMRLIFFKDGQIIESRDTEIGGDNFTQDIMNNFDITDVMEAEKIKIEKNSKEEDEQFNIVRKTFLMNYASEFLRTFQYCTSSNIIQQVDEIILTGGVAAVMGIEDAFRNIIVENKENLIKTVPYVARPLQVITKSNKISLIKFNRDEPGLFLVSALALRHFLRQY